MALRTLCGSCSGTGRRKIFMLPLYKKCTKCKGHGRLTKSFYI